MSIKNTKVHLLHKISYMCENTPRPENSEVEIEIIACLVR